MDKFLGQEIPEKDRWQFLQDNADAVEEIGYTHRFTPDELAQKKESLAETSIKINDIEIEKKEVMDGYKEQLKPLNEEKQKLLENIKKGSEYVEDEECVKILYHEEKMAGYYNRLGELVYSRPIMPQEMQKTILILTVKQEQMTESKLNLVVPKDYNGKPIEVVLREGEAPVALDPKEPERVVINGTIDAPFRWLEKRVELINQKETNIIVNRDKMGLALTIDETSYYQTEINGILQPSKEMLEFGINTDKNWEPIKLSQFLKMHRAFFTDKSQNMMLVSTLKSFKAKVNQDIERSKEENGSKVDNYSQVVDSNLPKSFKLNIPLFKGFANEEIEVEIYADVDGRDVSLSLVSAGANEAIEEYKNKVIDEQLKQIRQIAPDIVIIEV